jgi:hypothetical protein
MTDLSLDQALEIASKEEGLGDHYRDCVKPLLREPYVWPRCCGGGCDPCAEQLVRVASRTLRLLGKGLPSR